MGISLTKPGVQDTNGHITFYNGPAQAAMALAKSLATQAQPADATVPNQIPEVTATTAAAPPDQSSADFGPSDAGAAPPDPQPDMSHVGEPPTPTTMPKIVHPSAQQVYSDSAGNPHAFGPGSTKLGSLMTVLLASAQGGAAGLGKRTVGEGFQAARAIPFQNEQLAQEKTQTAQGQMQMQQATTPVQTPNGPVPYWAFQRQNAAAMQAAELGNKQADTKLKGARADKLEQDKTAPNDKVLHAYTGADGKQHLVMQKPDNSTYDLPMGDVNQKDTTNIDAAALDAMRVSNGGNPPTLKQIGDYQKAKAQNIHITPGNSVTPEIKPNTPQFRVAQDLAYGKMTMQQFRSLTAYSRDTGLKMALYDKAGQLNPNFNPAQFEMGMKLASNPKVQQQLASLDNVIQGAPDLLSASDAADRTGIKTLNRITNWTGAEFGGHKYSNFHTAQLAFADELAGALGYGSATDMSRAMGINMTDPNLSPGQFRDTVNNVVIPFVNRKRSTLLNQMGVYGQPGVNPAASAPTSAEQVTAPKATANPHSDIGFVPDKR